jgi:hypothetical protein
VRLKLDQQFHARIHSVEFQKHNGTQDTLGQPTYGTDTDWDVVAQWRCELLTAGGGEKLRGRQVSANTSHVLIGDPAAVADKVDPTCRAIIGGKTYNVTAVYDPDGLNREFRVECRQSW